MGGLFQHSHNKDISPSSARPFLQVFTSDGERAEPLSARFCKDRQVSVLQASVDVPHGLCVCVCVGTCTSISYKDRYVYLQLHRGTYIYTYIHIYKFCNVRMIQHMQHSLDLLLLLTLSHSLSFSPLPLPLCPCPSCGCLPASQTVAGDGPFTRPPVRFEMSTAQGAALLGECYSSR